MFGVKGYCQLKSIEHCFIGYSEVIDPLGYQAIKNYLNKALFIPIFDVAVDDSGFMILVSVKDVPQCLVDVRDMADVRAYFLCEEVSDVICPPGLDEFKKMAFMMSRLSRKGGYNYIIKQMVIMSSLHKGEFNDDFLFSEIDPKTYESYFKNDE